MEKVLINIPDKMCIKPLSKIYDLIDKFTCRYMTQTVYLETTMYHKIHSPTGEFQSNYHSYSPFQMWEVKIKTVTSIHGKPITTFVR